MYYHLLPQIKNAVRAKKDKMTMPFSKMDFAILKLLVDTGYVKSVEKETVGRRSIITIRLAYQEKRPAVNDFKLISKPSRHFYSDYRSIRPAKQGHGVGILSTSKGVMTDRQAMKQKIGGEYLFQIW